MGRPRLARESFSLVIFRAISAAACIQATADPRMPEGETEWPRARATGKPAKQDKQDKQKKGQAATTVSELGFRATLAGRRR